MKIGILAYHAAINFGAVLQLLSTWCYLRQRGHEPVILNWIPQDLTDSYSLRATETVRQFFASLRHELWTESALCTTSADVAHEIERLNVEAVIIGSDAVAQHHPLMERLAFPCRTVFGVKAATSDRQFPNAFWADWTDCLSRPVPVAVISASSQDSAYHWFHPALSRRMERRVVSYAYLSVRDTWTQNLYRHVTHGRRVPPVTPDPVFAFLQNAGHLLPSPQDVLARYRLPQKYILLSFLNDRTVSQQWLDDFVRLAERDGVACVGLPFADKEGFGRLPHSIPLPLSPLDWFALIRYSAGYVGHNMHPIVTCLHSGVPFFSFDNYGLYRFNGLCASDRSSKIRHILNEAGLQDWRVSCISRFFKAPAPAEVWSRMKAHPGSESFARDRLARYNTMMEAVLGSFKAGKEECK